MRVLVLYVCANTPLCLADGEGAAALPGVGVGASLSLTVGSLSSLLLLALTAALLRRQTVARISWIPLSSVPLSLERTTAQWSIVLGDASVLKVALLGMQHAHASGLCRCL